MSVLYHPSLGRFIDESELRGASAASGTDSDSYYRRHRGGRTDGLTRREEGLTGAPGSRRHRRFLNATMSESEFDTASEWDSDEDRPIVKFEWKQHFLSVGTDFFDRSAEAPRADRNGRPLHRRRLPKLTRRKRGELATIETGSPPEHVEPALTESKHAFARRMRAAKFSKHAAETSQSQTELSSAELSDSSASTSVASVTPIPSGAAPTGGASCHPVAESGVSKPHSHRVGQEHAAALVLQIEHSVRKAIRKIRPSDSEMVFLAEFESLLIAYKQGCIRDFTSVHTTFDLLPYDVSRDGDDLDTEVTSDDDDLVLIHDGSTVRGRRFARGEEPLHLTFRNAFERFLAHGVAQFHQLVSESYYNEANVRITEVRVPKAGVLLHSAKLVPFLLRQQANQL